MVNKIGSLSISYEHANIFFLIFRIIGVINMMHKSGIRRQKSVIVDMMIVRGME